MSRRSAPGDDGAAVIYGVHPVLEALERRPFEVERVLSVHEGRGHRLGRILRIARTAGVPVSHVPRAVLDRRLPPGVRHQGVAAVVAPVPYVGAEALVEAIRGRERGLVVVLDGIEDPRNLGAILRTAAAAGADGVLLGREATVGITPAAVKASAGTAGVVPIARDGRLPARLVELAEAGFRVVALDPRADRSWTDVDLDGPAVLVAGGESRGLRPGILRRCDIRVALPLAKGVESLNVSVALGVLLYEAVRQREPRCGRGPDRNSAG